MPMAGQNPVFDRAPVKWKTKMGATVVEREDAATVVDYQYRTMAAVHHEAAFRLQFIKAACQDKFRAWRVHKRALGRNLTNA